MYLGALTNGSMRGESLQAESSRGVHTESSELMREGMRLVKAEEQEDLTTIQPWEQALLPTSPLCHPRPRLLCSSPTVSLLLPIWSTICGHLPPLLLSPIPSS